MEWNLVIHEEDKYVEVITGGIADGDSTIDMAKALAQSMRSNQMTRALIDHRNVESVIGGTSGTYNRPKMFRFIGLTLGIRIAEIIRPEHAEHFKFFETVCHDQGYRLSVFQEKDQALTWLLA